MIFPGDVIKEYESQGLISVLPEFDERQLRPFGLRIHLGPKLLIPKQGQTIDLRQGALNNIEYIEHSIEDKPYKLYPGSFILGSTIESFKVSPTLMLKLDGRSTLARIGLSVHCTSSIIDGNHLEHRVIVLELRNMGPFEILLTEGIAIGMVSFNKVFGEASLRLEQDQYKGQQTVMPANLLFSPPPYKFGNEDE